MDFGNPCPLLCASTPCRAEPKNVENLYNTRVLVHNWFEERRQYHQDCARCTGHSIYKTDFLPHHGEEYHKEKCIPPKAYEIESRVAGVGPHLLINNEAEAYCDYMQNYMTTYDLMHNWEVRRVGCKPKSYRRWKLNFDARWQPQPDNAVATGNLTTIGFRQSPQLPMVPNDWHTYQTDTTYRRNFGPKTYPNDYVLCRYASSKHNHRVTENMSLVPKPGVCDCCRFKDRGDACDCDCPCHVDCNSPRFPTLVPQHTLKTYFSPQNVYAQGIRGTDVMKREPHPDPVPGYPILESTTSNPCDMKEYCSGLQQSLKYQQGPSLPIDSTLC